MAVLRFGLYPPNGYRFRDTTGNLFEGGSWREVALKVERHRLANKLPVGNPLAEITEQVCREMPVLCADTGSPTPPRSATLRGAVLKWLGGLRKEGDPLPEKVPAEEAARRSEICRKCSRNTNALSSGCGACKLTARALRIKVLGRDPQGEGLGACSVLAEDLATVVHLDPPATVAEGLPEFCWRRLK